MQNSNQTNITVQEKLRKQLEVDCATATKSQNNQRRRGGLISLLPTIRTINRREAKCLLRTVMAVRPSAHPEIACFVSVVMRHVHRLRVHEQWPTLLDCLKYVQMDALACQYNAECQTDTNLREFWSKYHAIAEMAMGPDAKCIDRLLNANGSDFGLQLDDLEQVTQEWNKLGVAMFAHSKPKAVAQAFDKFITSQLQWPSGRPLTFSDIADILDRCAEEAERLKADEVCLVSVVVVRCSLFGSSSHACRVVS